MKTSIRHIILSLMSLTAIPMVAQNHQVTVRASECSAGQTYSLPDGSSLILIATPANDSRFVTWSDGNTENPRYISVVSDIELCAQFEPAVSYDILYNVTIQAEGCSSSFNHQFYGGTKLVMEATPIECFKFKEWSDGNTDNPRTITVTGDATYTATFEKIQYTIEALPDNPTQGSATVTNQ